jgi:hypothetical protein
MKSDRREFMNRSALVGAALILPPWTALNALPQVDPENNALRGLLISKDDLPRIRKTITLPRFAAFWDSLLNADLADDRRFLTDEINYLNHVHHLRRTWAMLERSSFVYFVSGDTRHLEISRMAIDTILRFKKWDYFLEGGEITIGLQRAPETTIAMSLAREWLDDVLSPETKAEMEKQIAEKGAPACYQTLFGMRYPDRVRGWSFDPESDYQFRYDLSRWPLILNSTNLKVIPIAGLGMAACLLHGKHPQAERWLDMALQSARAFAPMYGSDGSYDEGVGYWGYTTLHLTLFVEAMYRTFGRDERLIINFPGTIRYALQMSLPTIGNPNDAVNFGDARDMGDLSVGGWIAGLKNDSIAQHILLSLGSIRSHFGIVWYNPDIKPEHPGEDLYDVRFVNDWVISRTGWDEQSTVVALRSGGPANHEHADRNSIIFKAYGERLLHDPFNAAYSYTLPLWILRQTEAHTAVLVDGKGHQYHDGSEGTNPSWAEARILNYTASDRYVTATSEATDAYRLVNDNVGKIFRTIVFIKPNVLVIFDRVKLVKDEVPVQLRFQIYNDDNNGTGLLVDDGFRIERPNAYLNGKCGSLNPVDLGSEFLNIPGGDSADLYIGMEQMSKPEIKTYPFIQVESGASLEHALVTVCTAQEQGKDSGTLAISRQQSRWEIIGAHDGRNIHVRIDDVGDAPEVTVL